MKCFFFVFILDCKKDLDLPKQVLSSAASSRPSGHRQNNLIIVERQVCEQFPLLLAHPPASSQLRPSSESFVFGKRSQEHLKLPQVLWQTSSQSPRPLFLQHSFMSVETLFFPPRRTRKVYFNINRTKKCDIKLL